MKTKVIILIYFWLMLSAWAIANENHENHHDHKHDHDHDHDDFHDHYDDKVQSKQKHTEGNPQVGPNKGVLEVDKVLGFKLSPEAEKNFEIKKIKISSLSVTDKNVIDKTLIEKTMVEITKEMIVTVGIEENIYRYRDGYYKRIDFETVMQSQKKNPNAKIIIRSKDLKVGDEIVISGLGFIRITEIAAYGGAPEGHSH